MKLGIRDFKAKSGKLRDLKYACELECRMNLGITVLNEILGQDHGIGRTLLGTLTEPELARWDHLDLARSGFSTFFPQEKGLALVIQEISLLFTKLVRSR